MKEIKKNNLIMFDCYGVLIKCSFFMWYKEKFGEEVGTRLGRYYCLKGDKGEYSLYKIVELVSRRLHIKKGDLLNEWMKLVKSIDKELISYIEELKKDNYVVLASNAWKGLVEETFKINDLKEDLFDKIFISCYMNSMKPEEEYYQRIINSFDVKFDKIIMIDDSFKNIENLSKIGINGILYKNNEDLKRRIKEIL